MLKSDKRDLFRSFAFQVQLCTVTFVSRISPGLTAVLMSRWMSVHPTCQFVIMHT